MSFIECLKAAFIAILTHKLRSFLTLLGVTIAVSVFLTILSALLGFNKYVDEKISKIGTYTFEVQRFGIGDFESEVTFEAAQKRNKYLKLEELEFVRSKADLVSNIGARTMFSSAEVKRGKQKLANVPVRGTDSNISVIENLESDQGRYFTNSENTTRRRVAYLGYETAKELFPVGSAIGKFIYINNTPYRVVGVQIAERDPLDISRDNFIVIPLRTYSSQFGRAVVDTSLTFVGQARNKKSFNDAVDEVRSLLRAKRKLVSGDADNFGITTPEALKRLRDNILGMVFVAVLTIPTIILLVGAVVIMNTMLVSVTERTNEIGLRRVVGASRSNILNQFLIESVTLTTIGGVVGLIIASVLRNVVSLNGFPTSLPWWAALMAIFISGLVGLLSGTIPAMRAASQDPIESLQAE